MASQVRFWSVVVLLLVGSVVVLYGSGGAELVAEVAGYALYAFVILMPLFYLVLVTMLLYAIPERPELTPVLGGALPEDMAALDSAFKAAGFRQVGPVALLNTRPKTRVINYVVDAPAAHAAYATVQKLWRNPPAYGLITPRADLPGSLETLANPEVDALPAAPGLLRQIVADSDVAGLVAAHRAAIDRCAGAGISFRPCTDRDLEGEMFASNHRQRDAIWRRPFYTAWMVLWRTMSGRFPNHGPLSARAISSSST